MQNWCDGLGVLLLTPFFIWDVGWWSQQKTEGKLWCSECCHTVLRASDCFNCFWCHLNFVVTFSICASFLLNGFRTWDCCLFNNFRVSQFTCKWFVLINIIGVCLSFLSYHHKRWKKVAQSFFFFLFIVVDLCKQNGKILWLYLLFLLVLLK